MKKIRILLAPFINILQKKSGQTIIAKSSVFIALIKLAVLKRLSKTTTKVNIRIGQFRLSAPNFAILSFLIKEKFVDEQYYFKETAANPIIFDCGSSIGISAVYFKCLYPNSRIYSFEPNPAAFSFLEKNITDNNLKNIHCSNLALSSKHERINFFIPKYNAFINAKAFKSDSIEYAEINVFARPLSEFLLSFKKVHLVKIDVEGSELVIMEDLQKEVLKKKIVKKFIIEYHVTIHPAPATLTNFLANFLNNGYVYKFLSPEKNEAAVDKLILAYLQD